MTAPTVERFPEPPDLIVRAGTVLTMNAAGDVMSDAGVAVSGPVITELAPFAELARRFAGVPVIGGLHAVATPGYVNAHQHLTGDRLIRSCIPDDLSSEESIFGWAVPVHAALTADDDELSATLSLVEAVTNGITTTIEAGTVKHPHRVAAAMTAVGVRGTVGRWGWDVGEGPLVAPAPDVLAAAASLIDRYPPGGLVEAWVTLVGHDLMSDELAAGASELARRRDTRLTFHLSPHRGDPEAYLARTGARPIVHLERLGVLGAHVVLAHAVHLDDEELDLVLGSGTAVACCPWAYLRLAQGITVGGRHLKFWRRGGRLALGCDAENASDSNRPRCVPRPCSSDWSVTGASIRVRSRRGTGWHCSRAGAPRPSAWTRGSGRWSRARRPTSCSTTPPDRNGPR